ncbi:MAG TPA: pilus assembly protein [Beijerinckiaceae bacterium]|jgi:Flp pilus assembly protein TadG
MKAIRTFLGDQRGTTAVIFGLSVLPLLAFVGVAVDYSRGSHEKVKLQAALDATAIALVREADTLKTPDAFQRRATTILNSLYAAGPNVPMPTVAMPEVAGKRVKLSATTPVPTIFSAFQGGRPMQVGATTETVWGTRTIEVALALDTTGSMASSGKMEALKVAVGDLVDIFKAASKTPGDIKVSVVPFNTQVRIPVTHRDAAWMRYDVRLENPNITGRAKQVNRPNWNGCLADRDQRYDASSESPSGLEATKYVAAECGVAGLATMLPLTADLESVRTTVNAMTPTGATNVTIGFTTGLSSIRPGHPLSASGSGGDVQRYLILLTDGDNTQNRWTGNGSATSTAIDDRLKLACDEARKEAVSIYTVRVIAGNEPLLKSCATEPGMYSNASNAAQLKPIFERIAREITGTRLSF